MITPCPPVACGQRCGALGWQLYLSESGQVSVGAEGPTARKLRKSLFCESRRQPRARRKRHPQSTPSCGAAFPARYRRAFRRPQLLRPDRDRPTRIPFARRNSRVNGRVGRMAEGSSQRTGHGLDRNGRTARLAMKLLLSRGGYPPVAARPRSPSGLRSGASAIPGGPRFGGLRHASSRTAGRDAGGVFAGVLTLLWPHWPPKPKSAAAVPSAFRRRTRAAG